MASVSLYTRSKIEKNKDTDITIGVAVRDTNINLKLATGLKVPSKYWSVKDNNIVERYVNAPSEIVARLDIVKNQLNSIKSKTWARIEKHRGLESMELKTIIDEVLEGRKDSNIPTRMNDYLLFVIDQMKSGERRTPQGNKYAKESLKMWRGFRNIWLKFQNSLKIAISFEDISLSTYNDFVLYLEEGNYAAATISKYITILIASMNYGLEDKVHTNTVHQNKRFTKTIKDAEGDKVYLTEEEIEALANIELEDKMQDKARDLFLIGYYCAQRVSDYSNITKDKIERLPSGLPAFVDYQQKTGRKVTVPFTDENAIKILEKYNYNLPKMGNEESTKTLINKHIKEVCKQAGINSDHVKEEMKGGKLTKTTVPKYKCVVSHTARRSAITNMYKSGILSESQIMFISGHQTHSSFKKYICLTNEEQAEIIAKQLSEAKQRAEAQQEASQQTKE